MKFLCVAFLLFIFLCCSQPYHNGVNMGLITKSGNTLIHRIGLPTGYTRVAGDSTSFTYFLRSQKLKPDSAQVHLYNGEVKRNDVHAAVLDIDCGKKDLQQCADACIRLRAEYLWHTRQFEKIHFNLTNGFRMGYTKWREGNRLIVDGNKTSWSKTAAYSDTYQTFRNYLDKVFMYAGTLSVAKELKPVLLADLHPGDVFVVGGSPGHAVMVVDVATHADGNKIFLLAQGYMPAQDIHIIKNPNDELLSPWYSLKDGDALETMEWTFQNYTLGRFE
ncbi:MAG: DUF4846 domain-containing protein [Flavobacteriales bacterium]